MRQSQGIPSPRLDRRIEQEEEKEIVVSQEKAIAASLSMVLVAGLPSLNSFLSDFLGLESSPTLSSTVCGMKLSPSLRYFGHDSLVLVLVLVLDWVIHWVSILDTLSRDENSFKLVPFFSSSSSQQRNNLLKRQVQQHEDDQTTVAL